MIQNLNAVEKNAGFHFNNTQRQVSSVKQNNPFQSILENTLDGVKFSKHATKRLDERSLNLTPEQAKRLGEGIERAGEKGINDSLVLMDSMAFIVNVPSNTVVTALDSRESQDKIFTNIDGAVII